MRDNIAAEDMISLYIYFALFFLSTVSPQTYQREIVESWENPTSICNSLYVELGEADDEYQRACNLQTTPISESPASFYHSITCGGSSAETLRSAFNQYINHTCDVPISLYFTKGFPYHPSVVEWFFRISQKLSILTIRDIDPSDFFISILLNLPNLQVLDVSFLPSDQSEFLIPMHSLYSLEVLQLENLPLNTIFHQGFFQDLIHVKCVGIYKSTVNCSCHHSGFIEMNMWLRNNHNGIWTLNERVHARDSISATVYFCKVDMLCQLDADAPDRSSAGIELETRFNEKLMMDLCPDPKTTAVADIATESTVKAAVTSAESVSEKGPNIVTADHSDIPDSSQKVHFATTKAIKADEAPEREVFLLPSAEVSGGAGARRSLLCLFSVPAILICFMRM